MTGASQECVGSWQIRNPGTNSKFMRLLVQHNEMIVLCNVLLRLQEGLFSVGNLIYLVGVKLSIDGAGSLYEYAMILQYFHKWRV